MVGDEAHARASFEQFLAKAPPRQYKERDPQGARGASRAEMMKRILAILALLAIGGALFAWAGKKIYPDRWVYVSRSFGSDRDVEDIRNIARTASEHGLTGIVLAGMDRISLGTPAYYDRLKQVKEIADSDRLEIVPMGFGTGYGGAILSHDKNLAEGMLVKGALFVAGQTEARFHADSPARAAQWRL
jgi:hypothetical protein